MGAWLVAWVIAIALVILGYQTGQDGVMGLGVLALVAISLLAIYRLPD